MNLTVTGRNIEISDAIRNYLKKRIPKSGDSLYENTSMHFSFYVNKTESE